MSRPSRTWRDFTGLLIWQWLLAWQSTLGNVYPSDVVFFCLSSKEHQVSLSGCWELGWPGSLESYSSPCLHSSASALSSRSAAKKDSLLISLDNSPSPGAIGGPGGPFLFDPGQGDSQMDSSPLVRPQAAPWTSQLSSQHLIGLITWTLILLIHWCPSLAPEALCGNPPSSDWLPETGYDWPREPQLSLWTPPKTGPVTLRVTEKRNAAVGFPLKSTTFEGEGFPDMDSSDSVSKQVQTTIWKKKKKPSTTVNAVTFHALMDQLEKTSIRVAHHQSSTIAALDAAMKEISSPRVQVATLQAPQVSWIQPLTMWPPVKWHFSKVPSRCKLFPDQQMAVTAHESLSTRSGALQVGMAHNRKLATPWTSSWEAYLSSGTSLDFLIKLTQWRWWLQDYIPLLQYGKDLHCRQLSHFFPWGSGSFSVHTLLLPQIRCHGQGESSSCFKMERYEIFSFHVNKSVQNFVLNDRT